MRSEEDSKSFFLVEGELEDSELPATELVIERTDCGSIIQFLVYDHAHQGQPLWRIKRNSDFGIMESIRSEFHSRKMGIGYHQNVGRLQRWLVHSARETPTASEFERSLDVISPHYIEAGIIDVALIGGRIEEYAGRQRRSKVCDVHLFEINRDSVLRRGGIC